MDRIKGRIVDVLGVDCVLMEIDFIGNYNGSEYADLVKVHFSSLTPPFLKGLTDQAAVEVLQKRVWGEIASLQVQRRISAHEVSGRLQLEGVKFRGKKKTKS